MRVAVLILVFSIAAVSGHAEDGFTLGLEDLPLTTNGGRAVDILSLEEDESSAGPDEYALVYRSAVTPTSDREYTLALWDAPLGRVYHATAAEQSMLGRQGLVGGGRMLGLNMATTALGDGSRGGLGKLVAGERWHELTVKQKIQAGVEASFLAALLYYMAQYAD